MASRQVCLARAGIPDHLARSLLFPCSVVFWLRSTGLGVGSIELSMHGHGEKASV
jgi:hypothetical protein